MLHNIPFEIQSEIMKRLPVKSLLRFRSVSKSYKSLIHSSDFVKRYTGQQQRLFVCYYNPINFTDEYVSIIDDDNNININNNTFPTQRVAPTLPLFVDDDNNININNNAKNYMIVGSSHGFLCLFGFCQEFVQRAIVIIWNPCIRKAVNVVPNVNYNSSKGRTIIGFGVCRETTDPKIVKITCTKSNIDMENVDDIPWEVEVFTLSTRVWRRPYSSSLPRKSVYIRWDQVVVDGCLYWLAHDCITMEDGTLKYYYLIVSFDITSEEFGEVNFPDSLPDTVSICSLTLYKLNESLVVVEHGVEICVWMMEDDDVTKSFKKLFTISRHSPDTSIVRVTGFRKTGEPFIELETYPGGTRRLAAYEPSSKSFTNVGIIGRHFSVYPYLETILVL